METQRTLLFVALIFIAAVLYQKWIVFTTPQLETTSAQNLSSGTPGDIATQNNVSDVLPATPTTTQDIRLPDIAAEANPSAELIRVETDLLEALINPQGGVIESIKLKQEPVALDQPDQGFALLKKTAREIYVAQDGLLVANFNAPNHVNTRYQAQQQDYQLGQKSNLDVPLSWVDEQGVLYQKTFTFHRDSYVIDIDYQVVNNSAVDWNGYLYAQFDRTRPRDKKGGFGQLPSYTGGAIYTEEDKYQKVKFKEMDDENLQLQTSKGWVAMLQHYFVSVWMPKNGTNKEFYSSVNTINGENHYRIGYKTLSPVSIAAGASGSLGTQVYLGSKEQARLKKIAKQSQIQGLALTVDYGFLTFIADPLFVALSWINKVVNNWGWSIIILTILIKLVFFPLSAASYKSMAGMKKLQPRLQTLKERYKDDRQKFQMEMMALYKKEKINPAGGCLPILIQIPVFIALYWVLLESVEMRHAPFALWWQDLSAPDPYFVLPVLMGASMFLQQKLNPAPMDDIQKRVMMIMPIALTFLFLTFPQGLVLYWVVNNLLSIAQQWLINRRYAS